jgi:hypothetical protein
VEYQKAQCQACGAETRWAEVEGEGRIALDTVPSLDGKYTLDPNDIGKASRVQTPGKLGFNRHDETCPARVRDRERRERKL